MGVQEENYQIHSYMLTFLHKALGLIKQQKETKNLCQLILNLQAT